MRIPNLQERIRGYWKRTLSQSFFKRRLRMRNTVPIISFTFDDFPRSALLTGGKILEEYGIAGTYYVSLGSMGKESQSGELFLLQDLEDLVKKGHELGCHTYSHFNPWETSTHEYMLSINQNREALSEFLPDVEFRTCSYPIDYPRPGTKRKVGKEFCCCRAGGQKINKRTLDLNFLNAYFLDKRREDLKNVISMIKVNSSVCGWLIFVTHDVCDNPSPYGCTPSHFSEIVRHSVNSGAIIMPVIRALKHISA